MRVLISLFFIFSFSNKVLASDCVQAKFYQNMYLGMNYAVAMERAQNECRNLEPYDGRPTAYLHLATIFMGIGIGRDQAIARAYEIVYAPGGKGPKTKEEVDAKISDHIEDNGGNRYRAIRDIFDGY